MYEPLEDEDHKDEFGLAHEAAADAAADAADAADATDTDAADAQAAAAAAAAASRTLCAARPSTMSLHDGDVAAWWLRLDGVRCSKEVERYGLARPFDARFRGALLAAARAVMNELSGVGQTACAAFSECDEVAVLFEGPCALSRGHSNPRRRAVARAASFFTVRFRGEAGFRHSRLASDTRQLLGLFRIDLLIEKVARLSPPRGASISISPRLFARASARMRSSAPPEPTTARCVRRCSTVRRRCTSTAARGSPRRARKRSPCSSADASARRATHPLRASRAASARRATATTRRNARDSARHTRVPPSHSVLTH